MALTVKSASFANGGSIPKQYTCDGRDVSPPLAWADPPVGTKSFVLICDDPDAPAGTWVHWVIYNIPAQTRQLPEGVPAREKLQDGTLQGKNDFDRIGYGGPCPPRGKPHRYYFKLFALAAQPALAPGLAKAACLQAIEGHILARAQWFGTYGRA